MENRRTSRYNEVLDENPKKSTRMGKNQYLYDEINNKIGYEDITNLDTQTRIDLRSISDSSRESYQKTKDFRSIIDTPEKKELEPIKETIIEEPKVFDINSILEQARKNRVEPDELERKRKLKNENIGELQKRSTEENDRAKSSIDENELTELINTITSHELAQDIQDAEEKGLLDELIATNADMQIQEGIAQEAIEENKKSKIVNSFYTRSMDLSNQDFEISDELEKEREAKKKVLIIITTIMLFVGIAVAVYFILRKQGII